jgi:hypothetical protein
LLRQRELEFVHQSSGKRKELVPQDMTLTADEAYL